MSKLNGIKTLSVAAGAACLALSTTGAAQAFQINSSAFGSGAVVESFEGLSVGPNVIGNPFLGYLYPGVNSPFTFASGVTLTGPIPNSLSGVLVGDFSLGVAFFSLDSNGFIGSASNVPDGTAYLGSINLSNQGSIEFTFASDILRVGGFVTDTLGSFPGNNIITLSAFDALNNLLETVSISGVNVSNWGSNFLGLENSGGIRKITINGDFTVLDKLTFEAAATQPVPEPASVLGLVALGVLGVGKGLKRKQ
jgi:PEP-CTERM motif